jgi:hypothetical protein
MTVSGPFKRRLAAAKYFGIVRKDGDKLALTERGEAFLEGDDDAKRSAVMATGFGPIISTFSSKRVNDGAIEARLQDDWQVPEGSAPELRKVLIDSAEDAGLISDSKFDPAAIESVPAEQVDPPEKPRQERKAEPEGRSTSSSGGRKKSDDTPEPKRTPNRLDTPEPVTPPVQVVLQIDASSLDPAQLAELIREIRKSDGSTG